MSVFLPGEYLRTAPGINLADGGGIAWSFDAATNTLTATGGGPGTLDADTLDGIDSTGFSLAGHTHDHGTLTGLGDDDHPQYAAIAQAETITETWTWTDSDEVRLGTGGDLRLYHNGTNSFIDNDTGQLVALSAGGFAIGNTWPTSLATGFAVEGNALLRSATQPNLIFSEDDAGADEKYTRFVMTGGDFFIQLINDAADSSYNALRMVRTGITGANLQLPNDSQEIQIGAGQDLRLYHDGAESIVRSDFGDLSLRGADEVTLYAATSTLVCVFDTTGVEIPSGGVKTASPNTPAVFWRLGSASAVSPTAPNRTLEVLVDGTLYYIAAKTTND